MAKQTSIRLGKLRDSIEEDREKGKRMAAYVRESVRLRQALENSEELIQEHGLADEDTDY